MARVNTSKSKNKGDHAGLPQEVNLFNKVQAYMYAYTVCSVHTARRENSIVQTQLP